MSLLRSTAQNVPKSTWSLIGFIRKHWYLAILILVILPSVIQSIQIAYETQNPTYPFFQLATRLFTADAVLQHDVELLQTNPEELVGMANPDKGIWLHIVYYWKFFWNAIWKITGNVWLIFFPFVLIWRVLDWRNTSEKWKTFFLAIFFFSLYLFLTNTIILIHGIVKGNTLIVIPEGYDTFKEYFFLFKNAMPFHGLWALGKYIIQVIVT